MVNRIYPPELQLNKANTSDIEAPFLDLHLSISNGFVSSKIYDKRDNFDFDIVFFFHFWMVTFPVLPKRPRDRAVSAPDFGSRGRGFESRWRRDSSRT